jgi:hypothetical protein
MLVSPPVADIIGLLPVALLVTVNSLTAEAVVVNFICSLPLASAIKPALAILGAVKVLLVNVSTPVRVTSPVELIAAVCQAEPE